MNKRFLVFFAVICASATSVSCAATRSDSSVLRQNITDTSQRRTTQQRSAVQPRVNVGNRSGNTTTRQTARSTVSRSVIPQTNGDTPSVVSRNISRNAVSGRGAAGRTMTGTNNAASTTRAAISINNSNAVATRTVSREDMTSKSEALDFCREQYAKCMDDYCNIMDEDMGRCSCSANISNYEKTSKGLQAANDALQNVAQQIQYIGLSADDINVLFSETEAEAALTSVSDSTQLKNDLDKIKNMIVAVKPGTPEANTNKSGLNLDLSGLLSFSFDDSEFSLDSIFGSQTSGNNIINQRGTALYKTASNRCQANILSYCKDQGIDTNDVINNYDLKITKDCLAYEQNLTDQNKSMESTIRNANNVLQKARLMVKQNKNKYEDLRSCVTALDECMRTDFVCGNDYENCLDPSGKYIVAGEIVLGSKPGASNGTTDLYAMWTYGNNDSVTTTPWDASGLLSDYITAHLWNTKPTKTTSNDIAEFLQYKIGYNDGKNNYGLCMGVLNQCQNITYDSTSKSYIFDNPVVREYLTRTLPIIKNAQDTIINEYATGCVSDVTSCLNTNGYNTKSQTIAINACRAVIDTCMDLTKATDTAGDDVSIWAGCIMDPTGSACNSGSEQPTNCNPGSYLNNGKCTECSKGSYSATQNAASCTLCPNGETTNGAGQTSCNATCTNGSHVLTWRTGDCKIDSCEAGFDLINNACVTECPAGSYLNNGTCTQCSKGSYSATQNATSCTPCPNGETTNGAGQTSCNATCTNGSHVLTWRTGDCNIDSCVNGYSLSDNQCIEPPVTTCPENYYYNNDDCTACPGETRSPAGSTDIRQCKCPLNTYYNNGNCTACPGNSTTQFEGATSINQCVCPANTYMSGNTCVACPNGMQSAAGSTERTDCFYSCPANSYLDNDNCVACPSGSISEPASTDLSSCTCTQEGYSFASVPLEFSLPDGLNIDAKNDDFITTPIVGDTTIGGTDTTFVVGFDFGTIFGEALCASSGGTVSETKPEGTGSHCWCKITGFDSAKGQTPQWSSYWVYDEKNGACNLDCPSTCASMVSYMNDKRNALFRSTTVITPCYNPEK